MGVPAVFPPADLAVSCRSLNAQYGNGLRKTISSGGLLSACRSFAEHQRGRVSPIGAFQSDPRMIESNTRGLKRAVRRRGGEALRHNGILASGEAGSGRRPIRTDNGAERVVAAGAPDPVLTGLLPSESRTRGKPEYGRNDPPARHCGGPHRSLRIAVSQSQTTQTCARAGIAAGNGPAIVARNSARPAHEKG